MHVVEGHEGIHQSLDPDADGAMMEVWLMCFGDGVVDIDHAVEVVGDGFSYSVEFIKVILTIQDVGG